MIKKTQINEIKRNKELLIDLKLEDKTVLIFGGGIVGERKTKRFLQGKSKVVVISKGFSKGLKRLSEQGKVKLIELDIKSDFSSVSSLISNSDVVVAATDDEKLNEYIAKEANKQRVLVSVVDKPSISDFYLPSIARFGEIRIAIGTGGRSPAMSRILRERLEKIITPEDILHVELQHYARKLVKSKISDRRARRKLLYQIIQSPEINRLLKEGDFEEAKNLAKQIIERQ
jgi:precorrin-2 dehydrogenase/sirohydrochlorin ferrochelatase